MASPLTSHTLSELFDLRAESAKDNEILDRIKSLAAGCLPPGWKDWKIIATSKDEVLEDPIDPQVLNKIRFALPTTGMVRAFNPTITALSEKTYRDMKINMLRWPFCLGLVIAPSSLAAKIRGSAA